MQSAVASALSDDEVTGPRHSSITTVQKMFSAVSGALLTSLLVTPLDVVKFRLQSQSAAQSATSQQVRTPLEQAITRCCHEVFFTSEGNPSCKRYPSAHAFANNTSRQANASAAEAAAREATSLRFSGTLDAVVKIVRHEGLASLWHGLSPTLVMSIPATVIYFVGYESLRETFHETLQLDTTASALVSGAMARTIAATAISPIELVRTRMQSLSGENKNLREVLIGIRNMAMKQGVLSLWRGLGPTLCRDVPFSAIYWVGYESMKQQLISQYTRPSQHAISDNSFMHLECADVPHRTLTEFQISFLSGAVSGMVAATLTTPFDVAKTRKQIDMKALLSCASDWATHAEKAAERGSGAVMREVMRTEGYRGLFRGLSARVFKVAPACAIMISSYEMGKSFFGTHIHRHGETM